MGEYRVDGPNSLNVKSIGEMIGRFVSELTSVFPDSKSRLRADRGRWPEIEQEVHVAFRRGADLVGVGLMAELDGPELTERCEQTRDGYAYTLSGGDADR